MRDRIPTYPGRVRLDPVAGQTNVYDMVMADEPTEAGTPPTKANLLSDPTSLAIFRDAEDHTPDEALMRLHNDDIAHLLFEKLTAGSFSLTVPEGVYKIGVLMVSGGAQATVTYIGEAPYGRLGGNSGIIQQFILDVTPGTVLSGVVGVGGSASNGGNGGSTSFAGKTAAGATAYTGGQMANRHASAVPSGALAAYGLTPVKLASLSADGQFFPTGGHARNMFDPEDKHIYCGAGASSYSTTTYEGVVTRARGRAGMADAAANGNATAPGDGGGAVVGGTGGAGAPGCCLIYDLTGKEAAS